MTYTAGQLYGGRQLPPVLADLPAAERRSKRAAPKGSLAQLDSSPGLREEEASRETRAASATSSLSTA